MRRKFHQINLSKRLFWWNFHIFHRVRSINEDLECNSINSKTLDKDRNVRFDAGLTSLQGSFTSVGENWLETGKFVVAVSVSAVRVVVRVVALLPAVKVIILSYSSLTLIKLECLFMEILFSLSWCLNGAQYYGFVVVLSFKQWKRISSKHSTRWQHLSWLKASAFFS